VEVAAGLLFCLGGLVSGRRRGFGCERGERASERKASEERAPLKKKREKKDKKQKKLTLNLSSQLGITASAM
jgi:hypothetical protein